MKIVLTNSEFMAMKEMDQSGAEMVGMPFGSQLESFVGKEGKWGSSKRNVLNEVVVEVNEELVFEVLMMYSKMFSTIKSIVTIVTGLFDSLGERTSELADKYFN